MMTELIFWLNFSGAYVAWIPDFIYNIYINSSTAGSPKLSHVSTFLHFRGAIDEPKLCVT